MRRRMMYRVWVCAAALVSAGLIVQGSEVTQGGLPASDEAPFPVDEKLSYVISYLGVHCGHMEITSFVDHNADGGPIYRITLLARTTKFFDGIYRLRSRLDSFFDPRRMTSVRYEEHSHEKKKQKEEIWDVDEKAGEVVRTKNGEITKIPVDVASGHDPLAFIYRLRTMDTTVGQEVTLNLMTSKGIVETVTRATKHKVIRTKMGKCDAVALVPEPRDEMMFSKSGSMMVWIGREEPHRPCKIEFKLSFGTLVANLAGAEAAPDGFQEVDWENWGGSKGEQE